MGGWREGRCEQHGRFRYHSMHLRGTCPRCLGAEAARKLKEKIAQALRDEELLDREWAL